MPMEQKNMCEQIKKPEIIVFAGPNGSGKTTVTKLAKVCDVLHIYDNSTLPFRIFKKRKSEYFYWQNEDWSKEKIQQLTGITL